MMKKIVMVGLAIFAGLFSCPTWAQDTDEDRAAASQSYSDKYDLLVSKLGPSGVGIETVLENWEAVDPENRKLVAAKYTYYVTKAQTVSIVSKPGKKYLGNGPVLTLKDSLGNDTNYFEVTTYDDSLFTLALKNIDNAIRIYPAELEFQFMKSAALISYEGESPDMALNCLEGIVDRYYANPSMGWVYREEAVDRDFFIAAIQEYCYTFYNMGTPTSYSAFKSLSEKMTTKEPNETMFVSNIGSYYLVAVNDQKQALKYYNKVLKMDPNDYTAAKNCVLICRREKNTKLEKKYLPALIASTPDEAERVSAEARLKTLE